MPCNLEEPRDCKGYNNTGTYWTTQHAAATAIAKSLGILLIVVVPQTVTHSDIDSYN